MSLTSWILDPFRKRLRKGRPRRQESERRTDEVSLYLRRLEDRRVLTIVAMDDAYFVEDFGGSFFVSDQLGVLSNDVETQGGTLQTQSDVITTDKGATVTLNSDGSFDYDFSLVFSPGEIYIDSFQYIASNTGGDTSSPVTVTLYGGEVPIAFDTPTLLPIFGVESETPNDFVEVDLFSSAGGALFLGDTSGIMFYFGNNGDSDIGFSGTADDVNRVLDTLEYTPAPGFVGSDNLFFTSYVYPEPPGSNPPPGNPPPPDVFSQAVPLFVEPPPDGFGGPVFGPGNVFTTPDEYYVDPTQGMISTTAESGVLSNDFTFGEGFLFAVSDTITTDLGGTVNLFSDGSFVYTPPAPQGKFIDSFVYFATDEMESAPGFVTLWVGEVPVPEDVNVLFPLFTVESTNPSDFATVTLSSAQAGSLFLFNTQGVFFLAGNNGDSSLTISGTVQDLNFALDSLDYLPPLDFSGQDFVTFQYEVPSGRGGTNFVTETVPVGVFPIADPPLLGVAPQPVGYLPGVSTPVDINVSLLDIDGSEIPGFVILDFVPPGVIPSVGQQSAFNPATYFILPSELANLQFFITFDAPEFFTIDVIATSIETTTEPGVFGGPGGPLLPEFAFEPRFALTGQPLDFFRLPIPEGPPPTPEGPPPMLPPPPIELSPVVQTQVVFLLGPLTAPTNSSSPPKLTEKADAKNNQAPPPDAPKIVASVINSSDSSGSSNTTTSVLVSSGGVSSRTNDVTMMEEQNNEQTRRSYGSTGIYVRKLGSEGPGQTAQLPEELAEDYSRFMAFLKTLPNGDYVVYFKRSGQSHEQAALRQMVVKVRVVNHRLNPDPGEFKPAGEVAEPPQDPNAPNVPATTENPGENERATLPPEAVRNLPPTEMHESAASESSQDWVPIAASAWIAAVSGWKLQRQKDEKTNHIDQAMAQFSQRPANRFRRRLVKSFRI